MSLTLRFKNQLFFSWVVVVPFLVIGAVLYDTLQSFGTLELNWGLGAAIGLVLGGLVFDINGNYFIAFIVASLLMLFITLQIGLVTCKR